MNIQEMIEHQHELNEANERLHRLVFKKDLTK